jgi:nucleoside-diphosphate-sugar epimerase
MKTKVLVTGGRGFIGSALVSKLISLDYEVDVIDLKDGKDIRVEILDKKYDIVFHLAASRSVPINSRAHYGMEINSIGFYEGLNRTMDWYKERGKR